MQVHHFIQLFLFIVIIGICATGCVSRPVVIATDDSIIEGQGSAARLRASNDFAGELHLFATGTVERIREAAAAGRGGIRDALDALDEYDAFVQKLIVGIAELERLTRTGEGESKGSQYDFDVGGHSVLD